MEASSLGCWILLLFLAGLSLALDSGPTLMAKPWGFLPRGGGLALVWTHGQRYGMLGSVSGVAAIDLGGVDPFGGKRWNNGGRARCPKISVDWWWRISECDGEAGGLDVGGEVPWLGGMLVWSGGFDRGGLPGSKTEAAVRCF